MSKPLFDFETPETLRAWFSQDDPVMGGVSRSQLAHLPAGAMLFSGTVRLENNGGFASVRGRATREHADISAFNAIALRVRGDGKSHGFTLGKASQNNVMYQARFSTRAGEWQEIVLPYREFRPSRFGNLLNLPAFDGRDVGMYGFIISDKQTGRFALEVDNVRAVGP